MQHLESIALDNSNSIRYKKKLKWKRMKNITSLEMKGRVNGGNILIETG